MTEVDRIVALPVWEGPPDWAFFAADAMRLDPAFEWTDAQRLFLAAVIESRTLPATSVNGLRGRLGIIPCGGGKTLAIQAAASLFDRPLLLTRRRLVDQTHRDRATWAHAVPMHPDLEVLTYGKLSHKSGVAVLDALAPDAIFMDEAHCLGDRGRLKRFWSYLSAHRDRTRVYALSGSLRGRSIKKGARVVAACLRDASPIPLRADVLDRLAAVVDADGEPDSGDWAVAAPLLEWAGTSDPVEAFSKRFVTAPGVVVASGPLDVGASLYLKRLDPKDLASPQAADARTQLHAKWTAPDGRELVDAIEVWSLDRSLRCGFFARWPDGADVEFAEWFEARRTWARELRHLVEYTPGPWDTPGTAADAVRLGHVAVPYSATRALEVWEQIRDHGPKARETVVLDGGATVRAFADYAADLGHSCVVWYENAAVASIAEEAGYAVARAGTDPLPLLGGTAPVFVSTAWATGLDGAQSRTSTALALQFPTTPEGVEQMLARLHRKGQKADVTTVLVGTSKDEKRWREDAAQVAGIEPQRLLLADWMDT